MSRNQLEELLNRTLTGLGYELVHLESSPSGGVMRVFIDRSGGVTVEDCAAVSNHLTRLFAAENVDYDRLEVSSPGLDRPLRQLKDFQRFAGERAQVRMRVPIQGRKNFVGILRGTSEAQVRLEVDGTVLCLELEQLDKARLVPNL
ncbi:MAG TPA: ribosome maturation factor RimP [Burkholderiales bacterium]|nr:ribosome maturation factor RimP [Burkholderiales bacterium]